MIPVEFSNYIFNHMLLFLVWIIVSFNYWRYILFTIKVLFSNVWYCSMRTKLIFFLERQMKIAKKWLLSVKICKIYSYKISCYRPVSVEYFIEDLAFSPSYQLAPSPPPLSPISQLSLFLSPPVFRRPSLRRGKGGSAWGTSQIIRRRETLVLYVSINTLCCRRSANCSQFGSWSE